MSENLFWRQMWAKVNGKAVSSDAGSAEGGVDPGLLYGRPVRQICFGLWTDATFEVWMVLMPSLSSLFAASEGG